ncbi:saccharopine dehydrogenase-like NADP-dependent oxidoreductase [Leucobacter komagatae]|uniref:Saccharopine dehydrogenase-like NADP-dependent oxidoreductase n=1 Tax=Leucobacter komagatae TaxID=55969 RepID=A0A542Y292_9MICO|nr:saccharopine dehydrogenase NADP-binding domain-containing protein [Leucobacter komagatae]TQL42199.1 saccharopine dehydrogenase-like NADP-dependent oxidoreductase [Leucobacter komagatae]
MNVKSGSGATTHPTPTPSPLPATPPARARRVVVLGAAGAMGRAAVASLAAMPEFTEIIAADLDGAAASRVAEVAPHVRGVALNVLTDDLDAALDGAWGVLSALGPFTTFGELTLTAAIAAGCHYVDINDDWEPTLTALEHSEAAAAAGVTALIGMGASPGVSNLLAARAARELDEPRELLTGWPIGTLDAPAPGGPPNAATMHFIHQTTGTVRVHRDGEARLVAPLQQRTVPYPGYGPLEARLIGHPEPVTLPRTFPGLSVSENLGIGPGWVFDAIRAVAARVDSGEMTQEDAARAVEAGFEKPADAAPYVRRSRRAPGLWAWASGLRAGIETHVSAELTRFPDGGMAGATAIPAALGLQLIARGSVKARGVVTPEEAVDPGEFFALFEPFCVNPALSDDAAPFLLVASEPSATGTAGTTPFLGRGEAEALPQ